MHYGLFDKYLVTVEEEEEEEEREQKKATTKRVLIRHFGIFAIRQRLETIITV